MGYFEIKLNISFLQQSIKVVNGGVFYDSNIFDSNKWTPKLWVEKCTFNLKHPVLLGTEYPSNMRDCCEEKIRSLELFIICSFFGIDSNNLIVVYINVEV